MPAGIAPFNAANPLCTVNQCLQQVIGGLDNNPAAQYAACVAEFGSPSITTVTLPGDVDFSTTTTTVSYTDVIVTFSTTSSTHYETSTSYAEVLETATDYSATSIATVTSTVFAADTPAQTPTKKRGLKRRGCQRTSAGLSNSPAPAATSSTSAAYPIASNCADREEYSSACSCINAISGTLTTTGFVPGATEVVTVTESTAVPSTSTSVVTVIVSSTTIVPATTTMTATTTGVYQTTTTVVRTIPPTQTSYLVLQAAGAKQGKYVTVNSGYMQYDYGNVGVSGAQRFNILTAGGQPSLANDVNIKLYVRQPTAMYGVMFLQSDAQAGSNDAAINCTLELESGVVSCASPTKGFDTMFNCGAYLYLGKAAWTQSGCVVVKFKMSE